MARNTQYVWFAISTLFACTSPINESTLTYDSEHEPVQQLDGVTSVPKDVEEVAIDPACERLLRQPVPFWNRKDVTKENYCGLLADEVALCEKPEEYSGLCESRKWEIARTGALFGECMANPVDTAKLPYYVVSLSACAYGDDYDKGLYLNFDCDDRFACWRSIGIRWTAYQGPNEEER